MSIVVSNRQGSILIYSEKLVSLTVKRFLKFHLKDSIGISYSFKKLLMVIYDSVFNRLITMYLFCTRVTLKRQNCFS